MTNSLLHSLSKFFDYSYTFSHFPKFSAFEIRLPNSAMACSSIFATYTRYPVVQIESCDAVNWSLILMLRILLAIWNTFSFYFLYE